MPNTRPRNLTTILLLTLVMSLVGATSALAWWGMGGGMGHGRMMKGRGLMNLTPEQAAQVFDLRQKFMNDTATLRKEMLVKGAELAQLWKADKPDDKAIVAKVKELGALRAQLMEKAVAHRLEVRKIAPAAMGPCPMLGPGMGPGRGPGPGQAPGKGAALGSGPGELSESECYPDMELGLTLASDW